MSTRLQPWRDLFTQTVTVAPFTGRDKYGAASYGTAVSYRARLVGKRRMVLGDDGQQILSRQTCYLYSNDAVQTQSLLTLSTGDVGSTEALLTNPPILAVARYPDEIGQLYTALYLGG